MKINKIQSSNDFLTIDYDSPKILYVVTDIWTGNLKKKMKEKA